MTKYMSYIGHGVAGLDGLRDFTTAKLQGTGRRGGGSFLALKWILEINKVHWSV
jgi:hypothetical protein